jgi:hypothetical protein
MKEGQEEERRLQININVLCMVMAKICTDTEIIFWYN